MTVTSLEIHNLKKIKKKAVEEETTIKELVNRAIRETYGFE